MNEEELNMKSLYLLRGLAREIGVKAPTQKTKKELIKAIIDVYSGKVKPVKKSAVGRPALNNSNTCMFQNKDCLNCEFLKQAEKRIDELEKYTKEFFGSFDKLRSLLK